MTSEQGGEQKRTGLYPEIFHKFAFCSVQFKPQMLYKGNVISLNSRTIVDLECSEISGPMFYVSFLIVCEAL